MLKKSSEFVQKIDREIMTVGAPVQCSDCRWETEGLEYPALCPQCFKNSYQNWEPKP